MAGTIVITRHNNRKYFYRIGQAIGPAGDLLDLVKGSLGVAGQLIATCTVVVIADIVFLVLNTKSFSVIVRKLQLLFLLDCTPIH